MPKYRPDHEYVFHCLGDPPTADITQGDFDAIILDTTFLWVRWDRPRSTLEKILDRYGFVARSSAIKVALPQDDHDHCLILDEWLARWAVDIVFSPCFEHRDALYPLLSSTADFYKCLAGYIDDADLALGRTISRSLEGRPIDVGYRASDLPAWFGRFGRTKAQLGERFRNALTNSNLVLDVSNRPDDILVGDAWLQFIGRCRFMLGSRGGTSIVDYDGTIQDTVREYLRRNPGASFEEIEAACFRELDGQRVIANNTPRLFEHTIGGACNILLRNAYLPGMEEGEHYIGLEPDFSNLKDVVAQILDRPRAQRIAETCYDLLVESGLFHYRHFADAIVNAIDLRKRDRKQHAGWPHLLLPGAISSAFGAADRTVSVAAPAAQVPDLNASRTTTNSAEAITASSAVPDSGPRVMMLCDDLQIDRRILHEAQTLSETGCEVVVLGRSGPGQPSHEIDGGIKIERISYQVYAEHRQIRQSVRNGLSALVTEKRNSSDVGRPEMDRWLTAGRARTPLPNFGPPWLERWIQRQSWTVRNFAKALLWPPYRLEALRRYAPSLSLPMQYAIYLPTLLLTPRPIALRWHWARARHWAKRFAAGQATISSQNVAATMHEAPNDFEPDDSLNDWELALVERGLFFRPDIVHVHDLPQLRAGHALGRKLGVPVIYDAHEMYPEIGTLSSTDKARYRDIESRYIRKVNQVITVNPFIANRQAAQYNISAPTVILNATVLPRGFARGLRTDRLRSAIGLGSNQKILLFQGWITLDRSIGDLVKAMAAVPEDIHLALLGFGEDIPKIQKIAKSSGVAHRVHCLNPVPQAELLFWVASADAGIIPYQSVDENHLYCSPNKLFEFIAAGTPIIANDLPYLRSVVAEEGYGVVRSFAGPTGYAEAIRTMFDASLGGADRFRPAILRTGHRYLWSEQSTTLLSIYQRLTGWPRVLDKPRSIVYDTAP